MQQDQAETLAIEALAWLAQDGELLTRFLRLTGIDASNIRQAATEPAFLAGVLTFFMQDERLMLRFSQDSGVTTTQMTRAHQTLAGPDIYDRSV